MSAVEAVTVDVDTKAKVVVNERTRHRHYRKRRDALARFDFTRQSKHFNRDGNRVVVETNDGRKMLYGHNNQNFVQVGDWVSRGDTIAEVGATGRATGPHVHFEVKF